MLSTLVLSLIFCNIRHHLPDRKNTNKYCTVQCPSRISPLYCRALAQSQSKQAIRSLSMDHRLRDVIWELIRQAPISSNCSSNHGNKLCAAEGGPNNCAFAKSTITSLNILMKKRTLCLQTSCIASCPSITTPHLS